MGNTRSERLLLEAEVGTHVVGKRNSSSPKRKLKERGSLAACWAVTAADVSGAPPVSAQALCEPEAQGVDASLSEAPEIAVTHASQNSL